MPDDTDYGTFLLIGLVIFLPAVIVFTIATVLRVRRGRFHGQRTSGKSKKAPDEDETKT